MPELDELPEDDRESDDGPTAADDIRHPYGSINGEQCVDEHVRSTVEQDAERLRPVRVGVLDEDTASTSPASSREVLLQMSIASVNGSPKPATPLKPILRRPGTQASGRRAQWALDFRSAKDENDVKKLNPITELVSMSDSMATSARSALVSTRTPPID